MSKLTPQEQKVYDFILANPGCTTRDIINATYITCPSARITGLRDKGVNIKSVGQEKYPGARPFEKYVIEEKQTFEVFWNGLPVMQ